ncbi:MAG: hypothetical protein HYR57_10175 [Candidatus Koribacter versatilis]|nr:hypothetical protein [Candidatus Koribacter versatilis]
MQMRSGRHLPAQQSALAFLVAAAFVVLFVVLSSTPGYAIPAFARKYGLPCSACHEAWPKLNSFGQNFKDQGYQLNNDRDSPIWLNPSYWPVAMRITPHWHYESLGHQSVDSGDGTVEQTIKTSGFDLTGIDILAAGTLAKNVSFLLVPSIDGVAGTVGFESANIRLDNIKGSPWLNLKFGKFELDGPLSEKRMMSFSNTGGAYQLYHYVPAGDINDFTVGENQLGVELMGHSLDDHTRYAASLISSTDGSLGLPGGRSYDGFVHLSQGFMAGKLGLQRVGVYGVTGLRPTYSLTSGGEPIPGTGRGNKSFYRAGGYGNLYVGKFDLAGVYQHASDNVFLANGTPANGELPEGAQGATWNIGTFEGHYLYSPKHFILGRYELVRMSRQPLGDLPSDYGNIDVFTAGYRFYPFINSRAGFAWHIEFSTLKAVKTADSGADQRSNSFFTGFDFAF